MGKKYYLPVLLSLLLGGCLSLTPPASTPSPIPPSPTPVPPSPTFTPVPTNTPTPVPTPGPAEISATVEAGKAAITRAGVQPICLRQEDTDGDGELEWIGLHLLPGEPPRLTGFVLDGAAWYPLAPPESEEFKGLGEFPACELEVRDLNADKVPELVIWGHAQNGATLLHIFRWDGSHYALLGSFEGKGGIRLENRDGDLYDEVVVRWRPEGPLVWEVVYTWDGAHYVWTWDRYAWYYLDRPHPYPDDTPLHALASFYLALNDRDLPAAYQFLSPAARSGQTYEAWALGFATTVRVEVGAARLVSEEEDRATVAAQVRAVDNVSGRMVSRVYAVEWLLVRTEEGWRLEWGKAELLEEWEMKYFP